jgi:hypothetical protein
MVVKVDLGSIDDTIVMIVESKFDVDFFDLVDQLSIGECEGSDSEIGKKIMEVIKYAEKSGYI